LDPRSGIATVGNAPGALTIGILGALTFFGSGQLTLTPAAFTSLPDGCRDDSLGETGQDRDKKTGKDVLEFVFMQIVKFKRSGPI
jgi:hypothetical protein